MFPAPFYMKNKDFVIRFGKYRGHALVEICYVDPDYILWLSDQNVLDIDKKFVEDVRDYVGKLNSETMDIVNEHAHDIY